jgi:large subunit ribosomal protein L22
LNTAKDRLHSITGCQRLFSTQPAATEPATTEAAGPSFTKPTIIYGKDGRQFAVFDTQKHPKLKPSIVRRRLNRMKIFDGAEKNIRHSPWRLNLVCQLVAGLPFQEAMTQLDFCKKSKAPLVQKMLQRTANLADIRHGLQPSQLEVAECFATRGTPLKRVKTMGRGRSGRMEHKHSHMRLVLREVDFKLRIYQAPSVNQKKKWFTLQQHAEKDSTRAKAERDEIRRLEKATKAAAKKASA